MGYKRMLTLVLSLLLCVLSCIAIGDTAFGGAFTDTKGHWAEKKIERAIELELVKGFPDGTFKPNKTISRGEFLALIIRIQYPDLKTTQGYWAQAYIDKAVELELITKNQFGEPSKKTFNTEIKRIEMVSILWALVKQSELPTDKEPPALKDIDTLTPLQREQLDLVLRAGLMSGNKNGTFSPGHTSTRAQAATICVNISDSLAKKAAQTPTPPKKELFGTDTGYAIGDTFDISRSIKSFKVNKHVTYHLLAPIENGEFQLVGTDRSGKIILTTRSEIPGTGSSESRGYYNTHKRGSRKFLEYQDPDYKGSGKETRTLFLFEIAQGAEYQLNTYPETAEERQGFEEAADLLTNVFRLQIGSQLMKSDATARKEARAFSRLMVEHSFFDHNGPGDLTFKKRVEKSGISYRNFGENIAFGYNTPAALIAGWVNSEGHRHNMAEPDFDHCNIGIDIGPNGVVATQWLFQKK